MTVRLPSALPLLAAARSMIARTGNVAIGPNDAMPFDRHDARRDADGSRVEPARCDAGRMRLAAVRHDGVRMETGDPPAVATAGVRASVAGGDLPQDDPRVIAPAPLLCGGATATIALTTNDRLARGSDGTFLCPFPDRRTAMQGRPAFG